MSDFTNQLNDVKTSIEQLRSFMSEGNAADLSELQPKLESLNTELLKLPKEEGRTHIPALLEIDQALAELAQDFGRQREAAKAGIEELSTRLKASTAYAKSAAAISQDDESA